MTLTTASPSRDTWLNSIRIACSRYDLTLTEGPVRDLFKLEGNSLQLQRGSVYGSVFLRSSSLITTVPSHTSRPPGTEIALTRQTNKRLGAASFDKRTEIFKEGFCSDSRHQRRGRSTESQDRGQGSLSRLGTELVTKCCDFALRVPFHRAGEKTLADQHTMVNGFLQHFSTASDDGGRYEKRSRK